MATDPEVTRLVAPLRDMYKAGKFEIPHEAERLSGVGAVLGDLIQEFTTQSMLAGHPTIFTSLISVCSEVHAELAGAVPSLNNAALAVTATADEFVREDEHVEAAALLLKEKLKDHDIPSYPTPPAVDAPPEPGYTPPPTTPRPHGGDAGLT